MQVYRLLTGTDDADFCHKVTQALSEGWELHGSPTLSVDLSDKTICGQAVVKDAGDVKYHPAKKLTDY